MIKYAFKIFKLKLELKFFAKEKNNLPQEWIYIRLKDISSEILKTANINVEIKGKENIPEETCVFYPNHQSFIDPLLLIKTEKQIGFILKDELKNNELINNVVIATDSIYINREDTKEGMKSIFNAIENIKKGKSYIIFPEGTRTDNEIQEFKAGAFKLSTKTKTPIVPVAIINAKKAVNTKMILPITVKMIILKPLYYEDYKDLKSIELAKHVQSLIQDTINKELKEK
jgi:1-acyl-sn-glycerol-3-phosphate acyltransferase